MQEEEIGQLSSGANGAVRDTCSSNMLAEQGD